MGAAPVSHLPKMTRLTWFLFIGMMWISPAIAVAGPADEANAVIDRLSAAYNSNDPEAIVVTLCAGRDSSWDRRVPLCPRGPRQSGNISRS